MSHTEDDLRAVLDATAAETPDVEPVLARVRTGIARRRTRQRVVVVAAATGAAVIAAAAPGAVARLGAAGSGFGAPGDKPSSAACEPPKVGGPAIDKPVQPPPGVVNEPPASKPPPASELPASKPPPASELPASKPPPASELPASKPPPASQLPASKPPPASESPLPKGGGALASKPAASPGLRPKGASCPPPAEPTCTDLADTGTHLGCQPVRAGLKVPFRLGYLPAGARATYLLDADADVWVTFAGGAGWVATIGLVSKPDLAEPANATVAGRPVYLGDGYAQIDIGACLIGVKGFAPDSRELRRVVEGLTPAASCTDRSTWFDTGLLPDA
jgi:hypothetical protein